MVVNSQYKLYLPEFRRLCQRTFTLYQEDYYFHQLPTSIHRLLCHCSELQELYSDHSIGSLTEESTETFNKYIKKNASLHTFKRSSEDVCRDLHRYQLLCSDPLLISLDLEQKKKKEKSYPDEFKRYVIIDN